MLSRFFTAATPIDSLIESPASGIRDVMGVPIDPSTTVNGLWLLAVITILVSAAAILAYKVFIHVYSKKQEHDTASDERIKSVVLDEIQKSSRIQAKLENIFQSISEMREKYASNMATKDELEVMRREIIEIRRELLSLQMFAEIKYQKPAPLPRRYRKPQCKGKK